MMNCRDSELEKLESICVLPLLLFVCLPEELQTVLETWLNSLTMTQEVYAK